MINFSINLNTNFAFIIACRDILTRQRKNRGTKTCFSPHNDICFMSNCRYMQFDTLFK